MSDAEIEKIATVLAIPKEFVFHHWPPLIKNTIITVKQAIMNPLSEVFRSEHLVVLTFPMKEQTTFEF